MSSAFLAIRFGDYEKKLLNYQLQIQKRIATINIY